MVHRRRARPLAALPLWFGYALCVVVLALGLAWGLCAQADYGYPFWYRVLHIEQHIDLYGPQNRHQRPDLARLTPARHQALFHRIRVAVHNGGEGLEEITYPDRHGDPVVLLRGPEVQHLRDVADLIDAGRWLLVAVAVLWLPLALALARTRLPSWRARAISATVPLLGLCLWLLVAGPTAVFYQFHIWLFPAGHEWFFYWQDSLMSTLMKAPALFGGIAVLLVAGAAVLMPLLYFGGLRLVRRLGR